MSRLLCKVFPLLSLLLYCTPLIAQELTLDALMQELHQAQHPSRHFREVRESELLFAPIRLSGTLTYTNGRLIKHIQHPFNERYTIEGDALMIEKEGQNQAKRIALTDYPPLHTFVTIFRASLEGDKEALQQHYRTEISGNSEQWRLRLIPRDNSMASHLRSVDIEGSGSVIARFIIDEQSGDSSTMELGESTP